MKKYCLIVDQKDDINKYIAYHDKIWPEIVESLQEAGILELDIYHIADRLVMTFETTDDFSFERKAKMDESNPTVQKWEELMSTYQQKVPNTPGEGRWTVMHHIFRLSDHVHE